MKAHRLLAYTIFSVALFPFKAMALDHWHLPMSKEIKTLKIYNTDSHEQNLWISRPITEINGPIEDHYEVPAFGSLELPLLAYKDASFIHLKAHKENTFQIQVLTSSSRSFFLQEGWQTKWKVRGRPQAELLLSNLAPFSQTVKVTASGKATSVLLEAFESKKLAMSSTSIHAVEGSARVSAVQISSSVSQGSMPNTERATLSPSPTDRYFLVTSSSEDSRSFVVKVSDPELLKKISEQLLFPDKFVGRILIGEIDFGNGDHNRDFKSENAAPWSWQVKRIIRFAEFASQDCDGSPEFLEELLSSWRTSGMPICFWSYRITRELSFDEVKSGNLKRKLGAR